MPLLLGDAKLSTFIVIFFYGCTNNFFSTLKYEKNVFYAMFFKLTGVLGIFILKTSSKAMPLLLGDAESSTFIVKFFYRRTDIFFSTLKYAKNVFCDFFFPLV